MGHLWMLSATYAFILEDFEFFMEDRRKLVFSLDLDLFRVAYVAIRFCKQKNNVNNVIVLFYRNREPSVLPSGDSAQNMRSSAASWGRG